MAWAARLRGAGSRVLVRAYGSLPGAHLLWQASTTLPEAGSRTTGPCPDPHVSLAADKAVKRGLILQMALLCRLETLEYFLHSSPNFYVSKSLHLHGDIQKKLANLFP